MPNEERGHDPAKFPTCTMRRDQAYRAPDGTRLPESRCGHISCEKAGQTVSPAYCETCPLRRELPKKPTDLDCPITAPEYRQPKLLTDGTLVYERPADDGYFHALPDVPTGYKRKSTDKASDDAWVFVPLWPKCLDRKYANKMKPCGCIEMVQVCNSQSCEYNGKPVTTTICEACPLRRVHAA